jgi:hypothetical protein
LKAHYQDGRWRKLANPEQSLAAYIFLWSGSGGKYRQIPAFFRVLQAEKTTVSLQLRLAGGGRSQVRTVLWSEIPY